MTEEHELAAAPRVMVRPIGLPLPLGYSGLLVGGGLLGAFHLGLLPTAQQHTVGLLLVAFVPAVQLTASIFAFLGRDTPVATELGILAFAWLASALTLLRDPPGKTTSAVGVFAVIAALALLSPILATAVTRLVPAFILGLAALHLLGLGVYELTGLTAAERATGVVSFGLAVAALYGSIAFQLEDTYGRQRLPVLRLGDGQITMRGDRGPLDDIDRAPGVRKRF